MTLLSLADNDVLSTALPVISTTSSPSVSALTRFSARSSGGGDGVSVG
jgi:hypothetical protein